MLFDKLAASKLSSLPAANGIQKHPLTAKQASPDVNDAKVIRRRLKTIAVDNVHAEDEQFDIGILRNDPAAHHRRLRDTICGISSAFLNLGENEELDYDAFAEQARPICKRGYTTEDGSKQSLADCFSETGLIIEEYAATYAGQACSLALCSTEGLNYCCSYQQMCNAYGDSTSERAQASCALAECCYDNEGSTETCFQGSYPTTSSSTWHGCTPDDGGSAYAYSCCVYGQMCDLQREDLAATYPVTSLETACEVAACCKETDNDLIACQMQLLPGLQVTTTTETPSDEPELVGTEAAVTEPQTTTKATAVADTTTAVTMTKTEATTTAETTASAAEATTAVAVEASDPPGDTEEEYDPSLGIAGDTSMSMPSSASGSATIPAAEMDSPATTPAVTETKTEATTTAEATASAAEATTAVAVEASDPPEDTEEEYDPSLGIAGDTSMSMPSSASGSATIPAAEMDSPATTPTLESTVAALSSSSGTSPGTSPGTTISPTVEKTTTTLAPVIEEPNEPSASSHIKAATCVMGVAIAVISLWV